MPKKTSFCSDFCDHINTMITAGVKPIIRVMFQSGKAERLRVLEAEGDSCIVLSLGVGEITRVVNLNTICYWEDVTDNNDHKV